MECNGFSFKIAHRKTYIGRLDVPFDLFKVTLMSRNIS